MAPADDADPVVPGGEFDWFGEVEFVPACCAGAGERELCGGGEQVGGGPGAVAVDQALDHLVAARAGGLEVDAEFRVTEPASVRAYRFTPLRLAERVAGGAHGRLPERRSLRGRCGDDRCRLLSRWFDEPAAFVAVTATRSVDFDVCGRREHSLRSLAPLTSGQLVAAGVAALPLVGVSARRFSPSPVARGQRLSGLSGPEIVGALMFAGAEAAQRLRRVGGVERHLLGVAGERRRTGCWGRR